MYRVLVVEDDVLIRRVYPVVINWERLGFYIAGMVDNGIEALEFLRKDPVDVVMTDICMPLLNGIELAGEIKTRYPGIKTVILSAYSEFDYARKAIDYGVYSYLLKENEFHEVSECFRRIKEDLDRERAELSGKWDMCDPSVFFTRISEHKREQGKPGAKPGWILGEVVWDEPSLVTRQQEEEIIGEIREELEQNLNGALFPYGMKKLFLFDEKKEEEGYIYFLREAEEAEAAFSIYWYGTVHNESQTAAGAAKLKLWQKGHFFLAGRRIIKEPMHIGSEGIKEILTVSEREKKAKQLSDAMDSGSAKAVEWVIRQLGKELCNSSYRREDILFLVKGIYLELMRYDKDTENIKKRIGQMDNCATFQRLQEVLQEACYETMEEKEKSKENGRAIVRNAAAYIREHYREPLTLRQMAEYCHVHPNYFSYLFLEETGINFIDMLTELRLKEACRMLCETDKKIYEIAEETGYHKPRYFSDLFKKKMGCTPFEYREKYGK